MKSGARSRAWVGGSLAGESGGERLTVVGGGGSEGGGEEEEASELCDRGEW